MSEFNTSDWPLIFPDFSRSPKAFTNYGPVTAERVAQFKVAAQMVNQSMGEGFVEVVELESNGQAETTEVAFKGDWINRYGPSLSPFWRAVEKIATVSSEPN